MRIMGCERRVTRIDKRRVPMENKSVTHVNANTHFLLSAAADNSLIGSHCAHKSIDDQLAGIL